MASNTAEDKGSQIISEEDKAEDLLAEELEFLLENGTEEAVEETKYFCFNLTEEEGQAFNLRETEVVEIKAPVPDFGYSRSSSCEKNDMICTTQGTQECVQYSPTNQGPPVEDPTALCLFITRIDDMKVTEYVGEDISWITRFVQGAYTILEHCDFTLPDIMQIISNVFSTAKDPELVAHINTLKTSRGLGLLPNLTVELMLDNVEEFYNSKTNAGKWAKATDEG
eukprot:458063-Ditylum_brightwellii.AAC.1